MARYSSGLYARRQAKKRRRRLITLLVIACIAIVVFAVYRSNKEEPADIDSIAYDPDLNRQLADLNNPAPEAAEPRHTQPLPVSPPTPPQPQAAEPAPAPELPQPKMEPASPANPQTAALISEAQHLLAKTPPQTIAARQSLNDALKSAMNAEQMHLVKSTLSQLADQWLLTPTVFPKDPLCGTYQVHPGDRLVDIGKEFKVPAEILMTINKIDVAEHLRAGQTIKVINGPFHAKVDLSACTLDLYLQNTFIKSYPVGVGQEGMKTPTGRWVVVPGGKLIRPPWDDPVSNRRYHFGESGYALGERWVALKGLEGAAVGRSGFGIHGTNEPESIGHASSRGCLRMLNKDVIEVYNVLLDGVSNVIVTE